METADATEPAIEATDAPEPEPVDPSLKAVVARARAAIAQETTLRTRTRTTLDDQGIATISETIGQGASIRERGFNVGGCSEDPENRCAYDDYIHIGENIYVYQGNGAWSSEVIVPGIDRPDIDGFAGLADMLDKLPRMKDIQSNGTVVRGVLRGDAVTFKVEVMFDLAGRPIEYRLDGPELVQSVSWSYGVNVEPIEPPV